jgi:GT2 family glycosyltransferase
VKLSIVIVNYNVEYFLEQCLHSVFNAVKNIDAEVFVVDNNSVDGSCDMVRERFPDAILIDNKENLGFSKANNQAIRVSTGEYALLLNPDTVVEEDTFEKVVDFMDEHPDAGGLGCKMIDGKGKFLPESKRGLPTPQVAFYKMIGLSRIFPKSKKFGRYHLGYLDDDEVHEIEILAGCFMLMRKSVLNEVGLLDEDFFMYGEDIDLSYRIILGGYKNYYYPHTRIIHYKGESTKKSSVNYVFVFYNAMIIFARKHFSEKNARLFTLLINMAIYLRASVALVNRFFKKATLPIIDTAIIGAGLFVITKVYEHVALKAYPDDLLLMMLSAYTAIWMLSVWLGGGYDKPLRLLKFVRGMAIGTGIILATYALLSKDYQFSRIIILLGAVWGAVYYLISRGILHAAKRPGYHLGGKINKRFVVVGSSEEAARVENLLSQTMVTAVNVGTVSPAESVKTDNHLGDISQLEEIITIYNVDEVIFCAKDLKSQQIIELMSGIERRSLDFKIAPPESLYIIGSNSIDTSGDLYILDVNSITRSENLRNKRLLDFFVTILLIATLPINLLVVRKKGGYLGNLVSVFFGRKSWVGYGEMSAEKQFRLPKIKRGILTPVDSLATKPGEDTANKLNVVYAKDYRVSNDFRILWKGFRNLGR